MVVGFHRALGLPPRPLQQAGAIVLEHPRHPAHDAVRVLQAPPLEEVHHALPLAHVAGHHPVDGLLHPPLHDLGQIGHDLLVEGALELGRVDQVEDAAQPERLVEELHAAALELEQHLLHVGEAEAEVAGEVLLVEGELAIDGLDRLEVFLEEDEPGLAHLQVLVEEVQADAEGVEELQPHALLLVQRGGDVALQRLEAAGRPGRMPSGNVFAAQGQARGHGEDVRRGPEERARVLGDEGEHATQVLLALQDVDLVDGHHDLLAPVPDGLQEGPLALRERPVRGGHEQDEVRARDELAGQRLVLAQDGVRARACPRC